MVKNRNKPLADNKLNSLIFSPEIEYLQADLFFSYCVAVNIKIVFRFYGFIGLNYCTIYYIYNNSFYEACFYEKQYKMLEMNKGVVHDNKICHHDFFGDTSTKYGIKNKNSSNPLDELKRISRDKYLISAIRFSVELNKLIFIDSITLAFNYHRTELLKEMPKNSIGDQNQEEGN